MAKILIVEDEKQIREMTKDYFERKGGFEIFCAKDGLEGLGLIQKETFDLIFLDVMLPGMDGFTLMKAIRCQSDVPVIFLTAKSLEEDRLYGYALGCDDYVCKPFSLAELYAKTMVLLKRVKGEKPSDFLQCGAISLNLRNLTVMLKGEEISLASKEYALLELFMKNQGRLFTRDELLNRIWGEDFFGADRVVDNHVKKLRKALGEARGQIKTVVSRGYKLEEK